MNKSQKYKVITLFLKDITSKDEISNLAISQFHADGVEEYSLEEKNVDDILGDRAYSGGDIPESVIDEVNLKSGDYDNALKIFFYTENYLEKAANFVSMIFNNINDYNLIEEELEWKDWNDEWRNHFKTIIVSDELSVVPSWELENIKENELYLYPGQGFGTGGHETTFLCLQAFEKYSSGFVQNAECLDFGCGSGILGIAAIKKLAMNVDFCDIDPEALNNCLQNLEINFPGVNLEGSSLVIRERFQLSKKYNLVFANILENILILEKEIITSSVENDGILILSGILNNQVENIKQHYSSFNLVDVTSKGDWSCIILRKGSA